MKLTFSTLIGRCAALVLLPVALSSCDAIYDDLPTCRTEHRLVFKYDYNMKFADAFPTEVNSVYVWAFDKQGNPVWKVSRSGDALKEKGFYIDVPLEPGVYDFVSWCGLEGNSPFDLNTDSPSAMQDLSVDLLLQGGTRADGLAALYSDAKFSGLYHSIKRDVEIIYNPKVNETRTIELDLMKDTKYVKILHQTVYTLYIV